MRTIIMESGPAAAERYLDDVPLDEVTARRLVTFARRHGQPVGVTVARLLHDLLADQDFWDAAEDDVGADGDLVPDKTN